MTLYAEPGTWMGLCDCGAPILSKGARWECARPSCPVEAEHRRQCEDIDRKLRESAQDARMTPIRLTYLYCPDGVDACRSGCVEVCRRMLRAQAGPIDKPPQ